MNVSRVVYPMLVAGVIVAGAGCSQKDRETREKLYRLVVPVVLVVGVVALRLDQARQGSGRAGMIRGDLLGMNLEPAARRLPLPGHDLTRETTLALSARDPAFSFDRITAHVNALFAVMRDVARTGRLDALHPWVSDGLYQRLSTQARLVGLERELLVSQQVSGVRISQAAIGESYEALTVRVTFTPPGRDPTERNVTTQSWRLLRRLSVKTRAQGLAEGKCPQCGAPLQLSATQRCAHCEAIINSGEYDWVLSDVSPGATSLAPPRELLDLDGVRVADTRLAPEELADRATLAFWRWYEAGVTGETRRLARITTDAFLEAMAPSLHARPFAALRLRLGGAESRVLRRDQGRDEAHVVLWWHGEDGTTDQAVFRLVRPSGGATQRVGLSSSRCEGCLAPMTDAESPACEHCGKPWRDTWAVDALEPFEAWSAWVRSLQQQRGRAANDWNSVPRFERQRALRLAAAVAKADGAVSPPELVFLQTLARAWALEPFEVDAALASDEPASAAGLTLPRAFARELVRELCKLVFVDGRADLVERKLVLRLASTLGVAEDARRLIDEGVDALLSGKGSQRS